MRFLEITVNNVRVPLNDISENLLKKMSATEYTTLDAWESLLSLEEEDA